MSDAPLAVYQPVGTPDGPLKWVEELGENTPTFTQRPSNPKLNPCLLHHVPLDKRGPFRPTELANYEPEREYRTDSMGYLLCYGKVKDGNRRCSKRSMNRYPRCEIHGGRLHPLDKAERIEPGSVSKDEFVGRTRYQQFRCGMISIHDLDDEEIANQGFRMPNRKFYQPKNMPREMLNAFAEQIYERATLALRSGARDAAKVITDIVNDPLMDPKLRLQAAETLLDRTLGKAPMNVRVEHSAAWETIFEAIDHSSRASSRAARGVTSERMDLDGTVSLQNSAVSSETSGASYGTDDNADGFLPFQMHQLEDRSDSEEDDPSEEPTHIVSFGDSGMEDAEEVPLDPDWD